MLHAMRDFTVRVEKAKLIEVLKVNKRHHVDNYTRVEEIFRKRAIRAMEKNLEAAKRGDVVHLTITMRMPRSYEKYYDEAIGLLEMSVDDTLELTGQLYQGWVLDDWEWTEGFYGFMTEGDLPCSKTINDFSS